MKVSYDFDGVLETKQGEASAKRMMQNHDVYIITARNEKTMSNNVYVVSDRLGIPRSRVIFTNGKDKWEAVKEYGIDVHYDNRTEQVDKIKKFTDAKAVKF
jgi:uncharacterized HAD superfamily protein